jgi:hypothetical protein
MPEGAIEKPEHLFLMKKSRPGINEAAPKTPGIRKAIREAPGISELARKTPAIHKATREAQGVLEIADAEAHMHELAVFCS